MYAKVMPMIQAKHAAKRQPSTAVRGVLEAKTRAWKSRAPRLPKASTIMVAQLSRMAFGIGSRASALVSCSPVIGTSPSG